MSGSDSRRSAFLGSALAFAVGVASCQLLVPLVVDLPAEPRDATTEVEEDSVEACADVPPPPTGEIVAKSIGTLEFAAVLWAFDAKGDGELCDQPGFDLDRTDTKALADGGCENPTCLRADFDWVVRSTCDAPGGVDNTALAVYTEIVKYVQLGALEAELYIARGALGILFEIGDYNGEANDDEVTFVAYPAAGVAAIDPPFQNDDEVQDASVIWNGTEDHQWIVEARAVLADGGSPFVAKGYVNNYRLVVQATGAGILPTGWRMPYERGILTAKFVHRDGKWWLTHGRFGMSLPSSTMLTALGLVRQGGLGALCDGRVNYYTFRTNICNALDLPASGAPNDPTEFCRELSTAFTFMSAQSRIQRTDSGALIVRRNRLWDEVPCPDPDSGTIWCDDCAWEGPRRCPAPDLFGDASAEPADAPSD